MFEFFNMMGNYDSRKLARYENPDDPEHNFVSTARVTDSTQPYETGIFHPAFNHGNCIVVEQYDDRDEALAGHERWVAVMTAHQLPKSLKDVSTSDIRQFAENFGVNLNEEYEPIKSS